ncbi:MAG: class I tRNA ligase family protein [Candidatus Marinimicrobia bacterium]|nr:class I tRNA ligase family protein [Candidatus Neomarinimicrobiota bacterium]
MKKKFYVTTPIYYANDAPHLGHAYTSVLCDIFARYHRLNGEDVFFLTGTDEHGAKICRTADEKGEDVKEFTDKNSLKFKKLFELLNISNDDFIRTSDKKRHWPGVEKIWKIIDENGDIYKDRYKGLYCVGCEALVTEKDLVDGKCIYHDKAPEEIEEENYFFRLSNYTDKIKKIIEKDEIAVVPEGKKKETLAFLENGLNDISISRPSRDISWGIPVPSDSSQTIYVWFEALVNYISALGYGGDEKNFSKFWPADLHVMAKDIMRFHNIIWPAMILSVGLPLPKKNLIHGFFNVDGKKMSKTIGNVVDPFDMAKRYGVDALRYYFTRETTPFEDGDFTEEKFKEAYNANLANGLGNYVSRVFKMAFSYFDGVVKKPDDVLLSSVPFVDQNKESFSVPYVFEHNFWVEYKKNIEDLKVNNAADVVWGALSELDGYIQNYMPFKLVKTDKEKTETILWCLLYGLANISQMIYPFMPETAEKIMGALGMENKTDVPQDFSIKEIDNLFPRLE